MALSTLSCLSDAASDFPSNIATTSSTDSIESYFKAFVKQKPKQSKVLHCPKIVGNIKYYLFRGNALKIRDFEWDDSNVLHIELGHGVKPEEAEEVFAVTPLFRKTKKGHYVPMGPTLDGRYLTVVFKLKGNGIARVITGWDMDKSEKAYWRKHKYKP